MTNYRTSRRAELTISPGTQAAKAKRRAALDRVRAQRAKAYKKRDGQWVQAGAIIQTSKVTLRYQTEEPSPNSTTD